MKKFALLNHRYKKYGWVLLCSGIVLWLGQLIYNDDISFFKTKFLTVVNSDIFTKSTYFSINEVNLTVTLIGILTIVGGLLVAFSKEKEEDEYINQLRLSSFQWAVLINYIILLIVFLTVFGPDFLYVMMVNMFTVLGLFIIRFHYLLYRLRNEK